MYIQVTTNPVTEKTYTLPLQEENYQILKDKGLAAKFPVANVTVRIVGRKNVIDKLTQTDLEAYIDYADVNVVDSGTVLMDVKVKCHDSVYIRVDMHVPEDQYVSIYTVEED